MKFLGNGKCEDCGGSHNVVVEIPDERLPRPEPIIKEKVAVKLPSWQPREWCPNGDCKVDHTNAAYAQKPTKRCANGDCKQYAPARAARCPWCDSKDEEGEDLDPELRFDALDEEELARLPEPKPHMHEGHNHD